MLSLIGEKYNNLVVIKKVKALNKSSSFWECLCDCGNYTIVSGQHLRTGHTKSCGCYKQKYLDSGTTKTHGMSKNNKTYKTWKLMRGRCNCITDSHYKWYGARGIMVCKEWDNFEVFFLDMGDRPEGKTLDRINPYGNYEKLNCRWATPKEQAMNRRSNYKNLIK